MGATFAFTESAVANHRQKDDALNGVAGGCAAGFLAGIRGMCNLGPHKSYSHPFRPQLAQYQLPLHPAQSSEPLSEPSTTVAGTSRVLLKRPGRRGESGSSSSLNQVLEVKLRNEQLRHIWDMSSSSKGSSNRYLLVLSRKMPKYGFCR